MRWNDKDCYVSEGVFMRFLNLYLKPTPLADEKMGTVQSCEGLGGWREV